MRKIAIFLNGEYTNNLEKLKELCKDREIISADGGTNTLYKLGLIPTKIVGDMDSIEKEVLEYYKLKNVEIISLEKEKDHTDFEVALLNYIPEKSGRFKGENIKDSNFYHLKDTDILVLGATGNRLDMTLTNLKKLHHIPTMYFITENFEIVKYINKSTKVYNLKGQTFSIIPITDIKKMTLKGFKYPLENTNISNGLGLASNVVEENEASIDFESGEMYIIY